VHDRNPTRRTPVVTYLLILTNVVVFLLTPLATAPLLGEPSPARLCEQQAFFYEYGAVPEEMIGDDQLPSAPTGAVGESPDGQVGCVVQEPPPYEKSPALSVLWAMFLHGGWLHLLGNMLYLFVFGNNVEDRLGRLRFLLFYLGAGAVASYGFALADPDSLTPLVGASGAVAGVLGAYLLLFPRARIISLLTFFFFLPIALPAWIVLGSWFLLQWAYSSGAGIAEGGGGVAYLAHVIGFAVGAVYVALSGRRRSRPPPPPLPRPVQGWPPY